MQRPPVGFVWLDPGFPALTVPYHDTNDFWYSGHIGASVLYVWEFYHQDMKFMYYFSIFNLINQFFLLLLVRAHYIIDLLAGFIIAQLYLQLGERLSYFPDKYVLGLSAKDRKHVLLTPCPKCGWSNQRIENYIDSDEQKFLHKTSRIRDKISEQNTN